MSLEVKVDSNKIRVRLEAMPDKVRSALRDIVTTLDNELLASVKSRTPVKTGKLQSSFRGHVRSSAKSVSGSVDVDKSIRGERGIAAILEYGASIPAHEILPNTKQALAFLGGSAGQVFAAVVHHPATKIQEYSMLRGALEDMTSEIESDIEQAVRTAAAEG